MRKQLCGRPVGATGRHVSFPHKAQGRGFELGPTEVGTQMSWGASGATGYLLFPRIGERVVVVLCFPPLPNTPPLTPTSYNRGRIDNKRTTLLVTVGVMF